ncbi:hypothetical protein PI126_g8589 [Phytophthora idaei]|nr:hypothetical protein PI126_g8589 [Phytophthora idaei]
MRKSRWKNRMFAMLAVTQVTTNSVSAASDSSTSSDSSSSGAGSLAALKAQRQECLASPPTQITLTQSASSTSAAYVIYKDCAILTIRADTQSDGTKSMDASGQKIEIVESFPEVDSLDLSGNSIEVIKEADSTSVSTLDISDNGIKDMTIISIPSSVTVLNVDDNQLSSLSDGDIPDTVTSISIRNNSITSLQSFVMSDQAQYIDLSDNSMTKLSSWQMPTSLQSFRCQDCGIKIIAGVVFPIAMSLSTFDLTGSNVETFEVANSSVAVLEAVDDLVVTTIGANCSDSHATSLVARSMNLCVLPDGYFDAKYLVGGSDSSNPGSGPNPAVEGEGGGGGGGLSNWMILAMICLGAMMACILGGVVFVIFRRRQKVRDEELKEAENLEFDPDASSSSKATKYMPGHLTGMSRTGRTDSGIPGESNRGGNNKTSNTRIAVLVSAGTLRPEVHEDCPRSVRSLVDKCLAFDPEDRPSALQIHYELRNLELGEEELLASARRMTRTQSKASMGARVSTSAWWSGGVLMRRSLQGNRLAALFVLSAVVVSPTGARVFQTDACEKPAPTLATLRRREDIPSNAEVVYQNCTVVKISSTSSNGTTTIDASNLEIAAVSSFPAVTTVVLSGNQVTTIYEDTEATVKTLDLSANGLSALDALSIPSSVSRLVLNNNSIKGLDDGEIPDTVTALSLKNNGIVVLTSFAFSDTLVMLDTSQNTIHDLSKWQMPTQLGAYSCIDCDIEKLSGVTLPFSGSLTSLDLEGSTVDSFEIANSSMPLVAGLGWFKLTVSSSSCSDSSATQQQVQSVPVCVLPDAVYNSKFVISGTVSGSNGAPGPPPNGSQLVDAGNSESTASSGWMLVAMISGAALLLVVIGGAVGYLVFRHRRSNEKFKNYTADRSSGFRSIAEARTTTNPTSHTFFERTLNTGNMAAEEHSELDDTLVSTKHRGMNSTMASSTRSALPLSSRHLDNDIRTDQEMRHFRLMHEEVNRGKLIAKGGYGAVHKATFRDKTVVTKQLLPERARDPRMLNDFMDEIRTCASLDHPKIVTFIGFTFSSLMDLSAVFEYMPNGDLATLLQKQLKRETRDPSVRDSYGWFSSTKSERGGLKCKSLVALDIAEALVYLHSFESPMIHRDLKPNNVLMSEKWEAKLTDFGVSRELTEDQTMTAEIELDTCRRPYSEGVPTEDNRTGNIKHTNARIAVLVSAGKLRPSLSSDCPNSVRDLVAKCLDPDPRNRPSALQLHFELRNLELALDDLATTGRLASRAMSVPRNNSKAPRRPTDRQEHRKISEPHIVLIEDDDIALLSNERRDHVQYYV